MAPVARKPATNRRDIRNQPAYTVAEAAWYLRMPPATLRSWFAGRSYPTSQGSRQWPLIISPASRNPPLLSFWNLIEAHVLWGLRTDHRVSVREVRHALDYAQTELRIRRFLLRTELRTAAGRLFLDRYGELIDLSAAGQLAMREIFAAHLRRVEWDASNFPIRLYPFLPPETPSDRRSITIDAAIAFGRPIVQSRSITTEVIADRIDAGEAISDVAADYDLSEEEVKEAVVYERAA
ncbi:MAG: DUF433 domain-containing protein [Gemmatimonadales bacterium]